MDVLTMVVAIVAISCCAGVINNYLKTRRMAYRRVVDDDLQAELDSLRQRIAVLEEIVTDNRYHLNQELNRLERQA
jgi:hypothetical protein